MEGINVRVNGPQGLQDNLKSYNIVVLKPHIVNDVNVLISDMLNAENTKYVIRWNYILNETITVPEGCIIELEGGSITGNGTLVGQNTILINESLNSSLVSVTLSGTWHNENVFEKGTGANSVQQTGTYAQATGERAVAEGSATLASGIASHAEGNESIASGNAAHAEGQGYAQGAGSHAEGIRSVANGRGSHAGGRMSIADGEFSFASGEYLETKNEGEAALGKYNLSNDTEGEKTLFSVGNGTSVNDRKNALEVKENDDILIKEDGRDCRLQAPFHGKVYLEENLMYKGYHFKEFVSEVTTESTVLIGDPDAVVYDEPNTRFLGVVGYGTPEAKYYNNWTGDTSTIYVNPSNDTTFVCDEDEKGYNWVDSALVEKTEGTKYNVLTQRMFGKTNVIYIVQRDFDLNGQSLTVPEGCTLQFEGGSITNGTLNINGAKVLPNYNALKNSTLTVTGNPALGTVSILENGILTTFNGTKWIEEDGASAGVRRGGTTAQRPIYSEVYVGFEYFDTDLNASVYWDGEDWVSALNDIVLDKDYNSLAFTGLGRVNLTMNIMPLGLPFDDFIGGVDIEQESIVDVPERIYWCTEHDKFIGLFNNDYYDTWDCEDASKYITPNTTDKFVCLSNKTAYTYGGSELIPVSNPTRKNVLLQSMINKADTIYRIQYDYDLNSQTITIPGGCTLKFDGGSLRNGEVVLNNCEVLPSYKNIIGVDLTLTGVPKVGTIGWDNTNGKPIWSDGTQWVYADGTTVS